MTTARKNSAAPAPPSVPGDQLSFDRYVAVKALSIHELAFLPGDQISEAAVAELPAGRLDQLVRTGTLRRQ